MTRELQATACQDKCDWRSADEQLDGLQVFRCGGCNSEWTTSQGWTPRNLDGEVPAEVAAARAAAVSHTVVGETPVEPLSGPAGGGGSVGSW